jgi:hypothetical protein
MSQDHSMPMSSPQRGTAAAVPAPGAMLGADIDQQRRALQDQVAALRQAGALPSASAAGPAVSAVQWNNWSNG